MADADQSRPVWVDSFAAPEGVYSKAYDLALPNHPGQGPAASASTSTATPPQQANGSGAAAEPPPSFPSKLATVTVRFPIVAQQSSGGGFLGSSKRQREISANTLGSPTIDSQSSPFSPAAPAPHTLGVAAGSDSSPHHDGSSIHSSDDPGSSIHSTPLSAAAATLPPTAPINVPIAPPAPTQSSPQFVRRRPTLGLSTLSSLSGGMAVGGGGQARPKAAFKGTNSNFVKSYEGLPLAPAVLKSFSTDTTLKEGSPASPNESREIERTFAIYTQGKMVVWCDMTPSAPSASATPRPGLATTGLAGSKEPLARLVFAAHATSVTVNPFTAGPSMLDVLVGFSTGDIIYLDPFSARYTRFNKGGNVVASAVTAIIWVTGRDALFMSAHADGTAVVWDKERDDPASFAINPWPPPPLDVDDDDDDDGPEPPMTAMTDGTVVADGHQNGTHVPRSTARAKLLGSGKAGGKRPRDARADDIVVTQNWASTDKRAKTNPVTHWRLSRKAVKDVAFSPDLQHCAVVSEDGCLRILDAATERLLDTYVGYFGALTCVAWSADGRFVFTGGQDDLVTVYSPLEQRVVARCQGHSSFITSIAFDPWQTDERTSRFASVSEDCKVIFWDLSSAALSRPRTAPLATRRHSIGSTLSLSLSRRRTLESQTNLASSPLGLDREAMFHPSPGRNEVSILQPVITRHISSGPLSAIQFNGSSFSTLSRSGQLKLFSRPPAPSSPVGRHHQHHRDSSVVGLPFVGPTGLPGGGGGGDGKRKKGKGQRRAKREVGSVVGRRKHLVGEDPAMVSLVQSFESDVQVGEAI